MSKTKTKITIEHENSTYILEVEGFHMCETNKVHRDFHNMEQGSETQVQIFGILDGETILIQRVGEDSDEG